MIVTPNLYGDIVSDIAAQIAGSVGLAGSANIGDQCAMFEAVHGSAPDIAGEGIANPSGLLHAAILMLDHLGQHDVAELLHNAWLRTIEDGVLTSDIALPNESGKIVGTDAFAHAVANRLGKQPRMLAPAIHRPNDAGTADDAGRYTPSKRPVKALVGVDVFLDWDEPGRDPNQLGSMLEAIAAPDLKLKMITNRGTKVYPDGQPETFCTDHWRCRFTDAHDRELGHERIIQLLDRMAVEGLDFIKTEHLYTFDGERGYSLGQGE